MNDYRLIMLAPDGEHVCEGWFPTIEACFERAENMGSRWFFYPFALVVDDNSLIVAGCPDLWDALDDSTLSLETMASYMARNVDYFNTVAAS